MKCFLCLCGFRSEDSPFGKISVFLFYVKQAIESIRRGKREVFDEVYTQRDILRGTLIPVGDSEN